METESKGYGHLAGWVAIGGGDCNKKKQNALWRESLDFIVARAVIRGAKTIAKRSGPSGRSRSQWLPNIPSVPHFAKVTAT